MCGRLDNGNSTGDDWRAEAEGGDGLPLLDGRTGSGRVELPGPVRERGERLSSGTTRTPGPLGSHRERENSAG
jgi:hypothetical protein